MNELKILKNLKIILTLKTQRIISCSPRELWPNEVVGLLLHFTSSVRRLGQRLVVGFPLFLNGGETTAKWAN